MKIYLLFDEILSNNFDIIEFYKNLFSDTYEIYNNQNYHEILKIIDKNLSKKPYDALMWAYKGYILFKLSYIEDGLKCVDISLNIDDLNDFTWLLKAMIFKSQNKLNESLICYKEFVVLKYDADIDMDPIVVPTRIIDVNINPNERYNFKGQFDKVFNTESDLFNWVNVENFKLKKLNYNQYNNVLNRITDTAREIFSQTIKNNFINFNSLSTVDKIILITKIFVNVSYKSEGEELGEYNLNSIIIDDRLFDANKINTLLHELAHHLLAEIFEQCVMEILNCEKTMIIENFVADFLSEDEYNLMDEYCAHAVEGRFTPHGYQNYSSYNELREDISIKFNPVFIDLLIQLGNTLSKDVLQIIESFIDDELRQEIYQQFKIDINFRPTYVDIKQECRVVLNNQEKLETLSMFLSDYFVKMVK